MTSDVSKERAFVVGTWVRNAEPGDEVIYWIGEHCGGPHRKAFYRASGAGEVILFQRRADDGRFAYHARRTRK